MRLIRLDKARETVPIVLSLIRDSSWCYTWGLVSVCTIVPVLSFQVYEVWKSRKEGPHKVVQNIIGTVAIAANGSWMVSDLYFHDGFRSYAKWIFNLGFIFLGLFLVVSYRRSKTEQKEEVQRVMTVSQEAGGIVFLHTRRHLHRRPVPHMMARPRMRK